MSDPKDCLSGAAIEARLRELAGFTDIAGEMTRLTLSSAHKNAVEYLGKLFRAAGMTTHVDPLGNLVGHFAPDGCGQKTLLIGSHIDTVRDAGIYDGNLGVMVGLAVIESFHRAGVVPPAAIELIAFSDEEGARFPSTLSGSKSIAGRYDPRWLDEVDEKGVRRRGALVAFGAPLTEPRLVARDPATTLGYVEVHIEQGPVLEAGSLPLGVVTAINGVTRGEVSVRGVAGHAGTLPMAMRHDALAAAAEMILSIEERGRADKDLVATVGVIEAIGGAINVVSGKTRFTFDVRAPSDDLRQRAVADIRVRIDRIARARNVEAVFEIRHEADATPCDPAMSTALEQRIAATGLDVIRLPSGAGHDAMSFRGVLPVAMLFVRCRGGVSHNPAEFASEEDIGLSARVLHDFVLGLGL
jgi:allantoate deiminase